MSTKINGNIIELDIVAYDKDGNGIAKPDGDTIVFVPYTLIGEKVRAEITERKKRFAFAKVIKVLNPAPERVTPPCPYFFKCGGCTLQHLSQDLHRGIKTEFIISNFKKIADETVVLDSFFEGAKYGYRNKAQLPVGFDKKPVVGYYKKKTHRIVPVSNCILHGDWLSKIIDAFLAWVGDKGVSDFRHLVARKIGAKVSVLLVVKTLNRIDYSGFIELLKKEKLNFDLHYSVNMSGDNVILGDNFTTVFGKPAICTEILGVKTEISPLSFMQVNDEVRDKLYGDVKDIIKGIDPKTKTVVDAYSGIGVMSNLLADCAAEVVCIENVKSAVADADKTAALNGNSKKIKNICGDVSFELPKIKECDALILDPPRAGCAPAVMDAVNKISPKHILYISCNPATLARDYAALKEKYSVKSLNAYDMFPQTGHVETLLHLYLKCTKNVL